MWTKITINQSWRESVVNETNVIAELKKVYLESVSHVHEKLRRRAVRKSANWVLKVFPGVSPICSPKQSFSLNNSNYVVKFYMIDRCQIKFTFRSQFVVVVVMATVRAKLKRFWKLALLMDTKVNTKRYRWNLNLA